MVDIFSKIWFQDHLLAIVACVLTLGFIYMYLSEKGRGVKLSKRYRNSIFEAQSRVFLNATQHLIYGHKDLAIKEMLSAVDLNRETIETYFTLGSLFRSNGEIDKAISIHRSLIARENIKESTRLKALIELANDFDKGGFVDKAIETYKDVLRINQDQEDVIVSLCKIYENIEDWDQAYSYRVMLSKVSHDNQSETISHILVQKAKNSLLENDFSKCHDYLEEAFRFAPSVSAKLLKLKLFLFKNNLESAQSLFLELLQEHPMYSGFIFTTLNEPMKMDEDKLKVFRKNIELLKVDFLKLENDELISSAAMVLSRTRVLLDHNKKEDAKQCLEIFLRSHPQQFSDVLRIEYIKILTDLGQAEEALEQTKLYLKTVDASLTRHYCSECGFSSDDVFWRCPQCHKWETIQFRWKV